MGQRRYNADQIPFPCRNGQQRQHDIHARPECPGICKGILTASSDMSIKAPKMAAVMDSLRGRPQRYLVLRFNVFGLKDLPMLLFISILFDKQYGHTA